MKKTYAFAIAPLAAIAAIALVQTGCESASEAGIQVSPSSSVVTSLGQEIRLTASGWSDYGWDVADSSFGYLRTTQGESTVYVATKMPEPNTEFNQRITVSARGVNSSGTNSTATVVTGIANIKHSSILSVISISPASGEVTSGKPSITLTASGGNSDTVFVWEMQTPGIGALSSTSGKQVTYNGNDFTQDNVVQVVTVRDQNAGASANSGSSSIVHRNGLAYQAALNFVPPTPATTVNIGGSYALKCEGGSGNGSVSFSITSGSSYGECLGTGGDQLSINKDDNNVGKTITITATKAGDDIYRAQTVSRTLRIE